jgi:hypothetical protein
MFPETFYHMLLLRQRPQQVGFLEDMMQEKKKGRKSAAVMEGRLPGKQGISFTAFRFLPQVNSDPSSLSISTDYRLENSAGGGTRLLLVTIAKFLRSWLTLF